MSPDPYTSFHPPSEPDMPLRAILLFGFVILAIAAVAGTTLPPEVNLETTDGRKVSGRLLNESIKLKTDYGTQDIEAHVISRVTFSPGDEPGHDVIEFTDGNHVRGQVVTDRIQVQADDRIEAFSTKAVREIKALRPKQLGFWALALGLVTLAAMEIVLGIDNIIFLAIVAGKLPEPLQPKARRLGLIAALGTRILLLLSLSFLLGLTKPLFTVPELLSSTIWKRERFRFAIYSSGRRVVPDLQECGRCRKLEAAVELAKRSRRQQRSNVWRRAASNRCAGHRLRSIVITAVEW